MQTVFFTLCSNNYLAHAKTLGDSLIQTNSDVQFIIGLVDKMHPEIDYDFFKPFEILGFDEIGDPSFEAMISKYDIVEFNTAVKPFYIEFLFLKYPNLEQVFYLDPDLLFLQSVDMLSMEFGEAEILLTPNILYHETRPSIGELASLRHGMYNLGFIGLRRGEESVRLIQWWKERLKEHCRIDKCNGVFVDQKWMDLAPLFFNKIKSVKSPGWNMAWWNLSERTLLESAKGFAVNEPNIPLVFFHFSGFRPEKTILTERLINVKFKGTESTALTKLYEDYRIKLLANRHRQLSQIKPLISFREFQNSPWNRAGRKLKSFLNKMIFWIFKV